MDAGSLDKLQGAGVPEDVLGRITASMVRGLKFLKDDLQIIHRGKRLTYDTPKMPLLRLLSNVGADGVRCQMSNLQTCL